MSGRPPSPGERARFRFTKWGGRPHWRFDGTVLGTDDHGTWVGFPRGTHQARTGLAFDTDVDSVTLVLPGAWHVPTFHAPGIWCDLYVDVSTPPRWEGDVLTCVDLDLDVVRAAADDRHPSFGGRGPGALAPGEAYVDDEDEFAEHAVAYGYPEGVVAEARRSADEVLTSVRSGHAPYDGCHLPWLEQVARLSR